MVAMVVDALSGFWNCGSDKPAPVDDLPISYSPSNSTTASGETSPLSVGSPPPSDIEEPSLLHSKVREKLWCTDAEISGYAERDGERELQRWSPALDEDVNADEQELEKDRPKDDRYSNGAWDQFQANAELFGVESSFKSDLSQYTTALDVSKVPHAVRAKADRLAREIESGRNNRDVDDSADSDGVDDEEARWSAVPRNDCARCTRSDVASRNLAESVSAGVEGLGEQPRKHGTYLHVDGLGVIDQHLAWGMPGVLGSSSWSLSPYSVSTFSPTVTCAASNCLEPGTQVVIEGLLKAPAFNGRHGSVQSFDAVSGRYNIWLQNGLDANQLAKVKIENLRRVSPESKEFVYQ